MCCRMDEEGLTLDEHRLRASELAHRLPELRLGGALQVEPEDWDVVASEDLFKDLVVLFSIGSGKEFERIARATFGIDEL